MDDEEAKRSPDAVDHASGNGPLFAEVHEILRELREQLGDQVDPELAANLADLEEELEADAPDPDGIMGRLEDLKLALQGEAQAADLVNRLEHVRGQFQKLQS
jgi:hypothetical protein